MKTSKVLSLAEHNGSMTFAQGLEFIARTRRQLDRFDVALPHGEGEAIDPREAAEIRRICDELEADINKSLGID